MTDNIRVPLPSRPSMLAEDDVAASITKMPKFARRFSLDVAEDALAQMGREMLPHIALRIAERAVHHPEQQAKIVNAVATYLDDPSWVAPIIEDELRKTIRRFAYDMLNTMLAARNTETADQETE